MKKKVLIIGAGFGGLECAKNFYNNNNFEIILADKTNHHLFQPLLYQVATAGLSPNNIAYPIRAIFRKQRNVKVIMDKVTSIDVNNNKVEFEKIGINTFDYLVLAVGARHSYFGKNEWEKFAPGLKSLEDALNIRKKILKSFEMAELSDSIEERKKHLTFVIIGGGPTGVEMTGAIAEISRKTVLYDFRNINPKETKIFLIEGSSRLLSIYPEEISSYTKKTLEDMGVKVLLNTKVEDIKESLVKIGDEIIYTSNIIWAAGNNASSLLKTLNTELDKSGRVVVENDLSIKENKNVFVIGDACAFKDKNGNYLPALAPVAMQEGKYVANTIINDLHGKKRVSFTYFDKGTMATIGKNKAVAQMGKMIFTGFIAWVMWILIHVLLLVGFRTKILVFFEWIWLYITNQRSARLIIK
ncbi:MAG: NAD(P)/FAD-dependent oxidoreductase [Candidatus Sericytochromatia bacterium]